MFKNKRILLTIINGGSLVGAPAKAVNKKELAKVITSPYEKLFKGSFITPNGHYKAPSDFTPREEGRCVVKTTLAESAVAFMEGNEAPYGIKPGQWNRLTPHQKVEYHLERIANGKEYTYECI